MLFRSNEGLGWLESISEGRRYVAAITYMQNDLFAEELVAKVEQSKLLERDYIKKILTRSAARDLTMMKLESEPNA